MLDFKQRFEIVYDKFATWGMNNGFKPSRLAFARFLGVSQGRMQQWEKGKLPGGEDLKAIHDKLGFAYDWLISGEGEMFDEAAQKIEALEHEVKRLRAERLMEGTASQDSATNTGKAAGGQG